MRSPFLLSFVGLALAGQTLLDAQTPLTLTAPIQRVRLHPDEAWVTRMGAVQLPSAGSYKLVIENLPSGLTPSDLQISARGPKDTRLGDLSIQSDVRQVEESPEFKKLRQEMDVLREKRDQLEAGQEAVQQEMTFLKNIQASYTKEVSSRLTLNPPNPTQLLELSKQLQGRLANLLDLERKGRRTLEKHAEEEAKVKAELAKRSAEKRIAPSKVGVELSVREGGKVEIELSYRQTKARWTPTYEARLSEDREHLEITLMAAISQSTGESWDQIHVEISNARPSRSLSYSTYNQGQEVGFTTLVPPPPPPPYEAKGQFRGQQHLVMDKLPAPATVECVAAEEAVSESASVLEEASGLSAVFGLEGRKSVPADGEKHLFKVKSQELKAESSLLTTPRLDPTVYLVASFPAPQQLPLFPGSPVIHMMGSQRLGEAPLNLPGAGQPFSLSFGPYRSLRVSFRTLQRTKERVGTFTKENQLTLQERIELFNDGDEMLDLEVRDRILKSTHEQVRVQLLSNFEPAWKEVLPGVRQWTIRCQPKSNKYLDLGISIRWPKDTRLSGIEDMTVAQSMEE